jgi:integrase/recombinase XerD
MSTVIEIVTPAELLLSELGFDTSILAGSLAASSIATYKKDFKAYGDFAGSAGRALQVETLELWRAHLATNTMLSPNTINRMIAAVKRLVKEAGKQGYCPREVAAEFKQVEGVKVKALKSRTKANARTLITPEDMRRICTAPNANTLPGRMHRALLATLASSGCRISEIVSLTPQQIHYGEDDDHRMGYYIEVMGKNQTEPRKAPLSPEANKLIGEWLQARQGAGVSSEYIFTGFSGRGGREPRVTPIHPASAWDLVGHYAKACKLEHVKPHDFRRFVGTRLAKDNIRNAQKALGHKRIETTAAHYVLDDLPMGLTDNLY